jgi:hypothetical protein
MFVAVPPSPAGDSTTLLAPGDAAVTGFSGAVPPARIAPGSNPAEATFIDLGGSSLRIVDLRHMGGVPSAQLVAAPKPMSFSAAQIGQVFAVAIDDATPPNIYVAATSSFGLPIVAPGPSGTLRHVGKGAAGASFMPGLFGPQGGPGSVWKINGTNGAVSRFATVMVGSRDNSGASLGGLAYDSASKSLYVADRETGFIHRLDLNGRITGQYGHGVAGRAAQGLAPVPFDPQRRLDITSPQFNSTDPETWNYAVPERRVFGLAIHDHRLYYAVADGLQIWSVGIADDGSFGNDAVIELAVPPSTGTTEISKITFDDRGRMVLAERPAPTGAFDFEALAVPAIGRVLRYSVTGVAADGRRIWQRDPEEYATGLAAALRNGNGGVAIGYRYDARGDIDPGSCGGFMWSTGEDLRDSADPALAEKLHRSGPLNIDGLQGNEEWQVRHDNEPPLFAYFVDYDDRFDDQLARGHLGDVAIARGCPDRVLPPPELHRPGHPRAWPYPPRRQPPGTPPPPPNTPPAGCQPNEVRRADSRDCQPSCPRPGILVNGQCCTPGLLATNAACSNSNCPAGQVAIGPSNFCCSSGQVYTGTNGAPACCSGQVVNGHCQPSTPPEPPVCIAGATNSQCCPKGYVSTGTACCLSGQLTSNGICCPVGQAPSGPQKDQCVAVPPNTPNGPSCCAPGLIPVGISGACCSPANVTTTGQCCPSPVDPSNRSHCPAQIQVVKKCAAGYSMMPDGSCCNDRYVGADGASCNASPCHSGLARDAKGNCVGSAVPPVVVPPLIGPPVGGRPPRRVILPRGGGFGGSVPHGPIFRTPGRGRTFR